MKYPELNFFLFFWKIMDEFEKEERRLKFKRVRDPELQREK